VVPIARSVVNQLALEPLSCRSSAVLIALAVSALTMPWGTHGSTTGFFCCEKLWIFKII
jgi:hypothetical protein